MSVTLDLKTLLIALVLIALIILIIYAILAVRKLLVTLDHTNKVLEDVEVVSAIASARSQDVDGIITNVSSTVADLSDAVKGNQGTMSAVASIVKSAASIKGMMSDNK
ncbi:MAG: hypothetical protein E7221_05875 [Clostridiales bacterium]|jgi:uncharacterized protein YoxC|nr:hypothetical protein [Clostridiales bacterium]MBQ3322429.1 hypothetical protein [Bacillota bacterium]MBR0455330.1 hypothetical protein [Bacillota bacterium]